MSLSIKFGTGFVVSENRWTEFISIVEQKNLSIQYALNNETYLIYAIDGSIVYTTEIFLGNVPQPQFYSQEQNDADRTDFIESYISSSNRSLVPRTNEGKNIVSLWPTEGSRTTHITHDWTDRTTWYQESIRVTNEPLTNQIPGVLWKFNSGSIIDVDHFKIWGEDGLRETYSVVVEMSGAGGWTELDEQDPHALSGGDYIINYNSGTLTMLSHSIDAELRATYSYATTSVFTIKPDPGKVLKMRKAEVQFSKTVTMNDSVVFELYGLVESFAPHLLPYIPEGTHIPLGNTTYNSMKDFFNEANGAQPMYPAMGGSTGRGLLDDVVVMQWDYAALLELKSSKGMEIRLYLKHDSPFDGEYATATLYGLSEDE